MSDIVIKSKFDRANSYGRLFDPTSSPMWRKETEDSKLFIQCQELYANSVLSNRGYLFLNEVYEYLGLKRFPRGQLVGWMKTGNHDSIVSFGNIEADEHGFFHLEFNVDGIIFDLI